MVQKLYDDKLLVGQKTNRPPLPEPEKDEPGAFSSLFFSKGNNPTVVDRTFAEMWEQHVARYMKGLQHVNPGGWTYSHGWSDLIKDQTIINEYDTVLRERAQMEQRVQKLEAAAGTKKKAGWFNKDTSKKSSGGLTALLGNGDLTSAGLALAGGGLLLGSLVPVRRRRNKRKGEAQDRNADE